MQITAALYDCKKTTLLHSEVGEQVIMTGSPTCGYFGKRAPGGLLSARRPIIFVIFTWTALFKKGWPMYWALPTYISLYPIYIWLQERKACPLEERDGETSALRLTGMLLQRIQDSDIFQQQSNQPPLSLVSPAASKSTILQKESDILRSTTTLSVLLYSWGLQWWKSLLKSCPKPSKYCLKVGNCLS